MNFQPSKTTSKLIIICTIFFAVSLVLLAVMFLRQPKGDTASQTSHKPIFYAADLDASSMKKPFSLEDYYIKKRTNLLNQYYIDDNFVLWGSGSNLSGQLGLSEISDVSYDSPVKIAENVVSLDCSDKNFCIYLTTDGKLYGMGTNIQGILTPNVYSDTDEFLEKNNDITLPVLIMENVSYARVGEKSIVVLKTDGSVWWWGQYMNDYKNSKFNNEEHSFMYCARPEKILENCIYVTSGNYMGAAITDSGDLYTWGLNVFGQCGFPVTSDDFVRKPQKVLDNVHMVWLEKIEFSSLDEYLMPSSNFASTYPFNSFVQLDNGDILAAGRDLGENKKTVSLENSPSMKAMYNYSYTFLPIQLKQDSDEDIQITIERISPETPFDEVTQYLSNNGIQYTYCFVEKSGKYVIDKRRLILLNGQYSLSFDENEKFIKSTHSPMY